MKKLYHFFGNLRFQNKIILSTLTAVMIPLLTLSMVVGFIVMQEVRQKSSQLTLQMVTQTSESLDVYIGTIEKLMNFLIDEVSSIQSAGDLQTKEMEKLTTSIMQAYPEIAGITIAYADDSYFGEGMTRVSRDLFADEYWYQYAEELDGRLGVIGSAIGRNVVNNLNDSSDSIFSLVKSFEGEGLDNNGVVLVDIRHDMIEQLINLVAIGEKGNLYIADDSDIVYTPTNDIVYRIDDKCYQSDSANGEAVNINGTDYFIVNHYSSYSGWRVVGFLPETEFSASIYSVYRIMFFCIAICLLLVSLVSVVLSMTVTRPILKLCSFMEKVESGDFSVRFNAKHKDEIGILGTAFNHMIERVNNLINELYVEKQYRLEAQLKSLQEQIKPHFLYNTLDTISWMARAHNAMDVVHLVDALTNMFRVGLSSGRDYIMLREEKKHVENYLYIQKVRYQERLQYEIEIPQEYDEIIVPKLILQPLVENAIYHGVKMKRSSGKIRITAHSEEESVYIHVWDDGAGVSPKRLADIRNWLENPKNREEKTGFGLSYIQERIELSYGMDYGISIDSKEGEFTKVTVCLPIQQQGKS